VRPWLVPIALLLAGTVLAAGAGWGLSAGVGSLIALGEGEQLREVGDVRPKAAPSASATRPDGTAAATSQPQRLSPPTISRREYIDKIVHRNIFDHQNVGKAPTSSSDTAAELCLGDDCDEEIGEKSDLPVTLLGTIVVKPAEYSSAMIRTESSKDIDGYRIGDKLLDATITSINPRMVLVQRADGSREYILLDAEEQPQRTAGAPAAKGSDSDQIVQEGENTFVIDRQLFDSSLQDLDALSRMARAIPHRDASGNPDGFRLSGVRRDQLLYNLGIRSGDVIHGVNGKPLTTIAEAMGAMQSLQRDSSFSFEVTRRGQKMTMNYRVQ